MVSSERKRPSARAPADDPAVSVVIPALDEREALPATVREASEALAGEDFEVVIVDDGSGDGTWEEIRRLSDEDSRVRGVRFSRNFGHQAALLAGIREARGEAVITLDADGQHPPALIPEMIARWRDGAIVVQGLRDDRRGGTAALKGGSSRGFYRLFSWLAATPIPAGSADFRLLDRRAAELICAHPRPALFLRGFVPWTGLRTEYLGFAPRDRSAGRTKYTAGRMFGLARQGMLRFSIKPLRLATLLGALACVGALAYLVYVLVVRLVLGEFVEGWASVAGLLSLLGGVQLLLIGILGEYVGAIFEAVQGKPPYVIEQLTPRPAAPRRSPSDPAPRA
jgi:polyisoprenyl-phosphate glycosyltransferase